MYALALARRSVALMEFHYIATVITPAMAHAQVGAGSAYAYTVRDANGDLLDGAKTYRLHVDADPPAKNFWAVDVYDTQTRSLIQVPSTIWPALASNSGSLEANDDGSYDLYFGPSAPRQGVELGRNDPRKVVVPALSALRPIPTLVRSGLEAQRVRTYPKSKQPASPSRPATRPRAPLSVLPRRKPRMSRTIAFVHDPLGGSRLHRRRRSIPDRAQRARVGRSDRPRADARVHAVGRGLSRRGLALSPLLGGRRSLVGSRVVSGELVASGVAVVAGGRGR